MSILSANFCVLVLSVAIATAAVFMVNNVDNRRVDNFSAGPGCMPVEVLKEAQKQFISHDHLGMNIMVRLAWLALRTWLLPPCHPLKCCSTTPAGDESPRPRGTRTVDDCGSRTKRARAP